MPDKPVFEIQGVHPGRWIVLKDGAQVAGPFDTLAKAQEALRRLEDEL